MHPGILNQRRALRHRPRPAPVTPYDDVSVTHMRYPTCGRSKPSLSVSAPWIRLFRSARRARRLGQPAARRVHPDRRARRGLADDGAHRRTGSLSGIRQRAGYPATWRGAGAGHLPRDPAGVRRRGWRCVGGSSTSSPVTGAVVMIRSTGSGDCCAAGARRAQARPPCRHHRFLALRWRSALRVKVVGQPVAVRIEFWRIA